jgi:hypothetical protein
LTLPETSRMALSGLTPMMPVKTEIPGERSLLRGVVVEHKQKSSGRGRESNRP